MRTASGSFTGMCKYYTQSELKLALSLDMMLYRVYIIIMTNFSFFQIIFHYFEFKTLEYFNFRLSLFEILGSASYKAAPSCKAVLKQKVILNECDAETISSKAYHITLTDSKCPNDTTTETVQVSYCMHVIEF